MQNLCLVLSVVQIAVPTTCSSYHCSLSSWPLSASCPFCAFPAMAFQAMWACEMSLPCREQELARLDQDSCAKPAFVYTSPVFYYAVDEEHRDLPKTYLKNVPVHNLPRDSQRVGTRSVQLNSDEYATVLRVKMIMAHALFFLRALQFLFIIFCTHLYNEQCLASHHLLTHQEAFCLFINRVSLDITQFMVLFPHP